ncbi:HotDog domain-containing protein [Amylostereum chailletii]|nr:HotDog domain-containing protein [Amylostereum chailletii]
MSPLTFYTHPAGPTQPNNAWVDPESLPDCEAVVTRIGGSASERTKRLVCNTFAAYGVGGDDTFGAEVGKAVRFIEVDLGGKGRYLEARVVCELAVTNHMLNGAGMMHGGCIGYLVDNCASTPLVALGLERNVNGVGVTQSMQITYHSPAPPGATLHIVSTSVSLGSRIMTSRCEILDRDSGRIVASAVLNKMQPAASRL